MGKSTLRMCLLASPAILLGSVTLLRAAPPDELFEKKIRPIFVNKCQPCHGPELRTAGLNLMGADGFRKGADSGPLIDPTDLDNSRLLKAVNYQERIKMPPTGELRDEEIAALREWLKLGAQWPENAKESVKFEPPRSTLTNAQERTSGPFSI